MSSPVIWILMPGFVAIILFILRHREKLALSIGLLVSLTLAGLAWFNPIGDTVNLGIINLEISDSLPILGRQFVLTTQKAPVLISIYLGVAFWLGGAFGASTGGRFAFSCLLIASLMTAALAVEPFLYAALLIEMAAIVAVTMFAVPGQMIDRGSQTS